MMPANSNSKQEFSFPTRDDFGGPRNTHTLTDIGNPLTDPIDDS